MGDLIKLPGAVIKEGEKLDPSTDIITALEEILEEAKAGKLQAFAFAGVDGGDPFGATHSFCISFAPCRSALVSGVACLFQDLVNNTLEEGGPLTASDDEEEGDEE